MEHLVAIARVTGVQLEWLGTGRGTIRPAEDAWAPATHTEDYAQDDIESECLHSLRKVPFHIRKQLVTLISLFSRNY